VPSGAARQQNLTLARQKHLRPSAFVRGSTRCAFTLLELILVMTIIAIVAAVAVPTMRAFTIGRASNNAATQLVELANYARTQAAAEGRIYRMYFDPSTGEFWLTAQNAGVFQPPASNDFGRRFQAGDGVQLDVQVNPAPATTPQPPQQDQQENVTQAFGPISQQYTAPNNLVQHIHQDVLPYVEFQPSGRTDPVQIRLIDKLGTEIDIECPSATESFRIVSGAPR
jgi:prepilin-type N-terminal cleavage/methylation domain-containing protein